MHLPKKKYAGAAIKRSNRSRYASSQTVWSTKKPIYIFSGWHTTNVICPNWLSVYVFFFISLFATHFLRAANLNAHSNIYAFNVHWLRCSLQFFFNSFINFSRVVVSLDGVETILDSLLPAYFFLHVEWNENYWIKSKNEKKGREEVDLVKRLLVECVFKTCRFFVRANMLKANKTKSNRDDKTTKCLKIFNSQLNVRT